MKTSKLITVMSAIYLLVGACVIAVAQYSTNVPDVIGATTYSTNVPAISNAFVGYSTNVPGVSNYFVGYSTNVPGISNYAVGYNTNVPGSIGSSTYSSGSPTRICTITTNISIVQITNGVTTNVLIAFDQFTNYAPRFYWNANWTYLDIQGNPYTGAYTNGAAISAPDEFVGDMPYDGAWIVATLNGSNNQTYDQMAGCETGPTNCWTVAEGGVGNHNDGYFRFAPNIVNSTNISYTTNYF